MRKPSDTSTRKRQRKSALRQNYGLRQRQSQRFHPRTDAPAAFRKLAEQSLLIHVQISRTRIQEKRDMLTRMLYQLIRCGLNDWVVADSRTTAQSDVKARVKLWDALEEAGLLRKCLGSKASANVTRYAATEKLLQLQDIWPQKLFGETRLQRNSRLATPTRHALVVIQSKVPSDSGVLQRIAKPFQAFLPELGSLQAMEDRIKIINDRNRRHKWSLTSAEGGRSEAGFLLRQIHIDRPWNGTRLYTAGRYSIQNLSKDTRHRIQIDGRTTTEPDFSGSIPRLLYHHVARQSGPVDAGAGDIYSVNRIFSDLRPDTIDPESFAKLRGAVKLATNICINCKSIHQAQGAIGEMLQSENSWNLVQSRLDGTPNPAAALVARVCEVHPLVKDYFFQGLGMQLMTVESQIMLEILETVTATGRPALGIHDSVLCLSEDADFVKSVMVTVYRTHTGFLPVIK